MNEICLTQNTSHVRTVKETEKDAYMKNNSIRKVLNQEVRNVGTKEKSPEQVLTSVKDLSIRRLPLSINGTD